MRRDTPWCGRYRACTCAESSFGFYFATLSDCSQWQWQWQTVPPRSVLYVVPVVTCRSGCVSRALARGRWEHALPELADCDYAFAETPSLAIDALFHHLCVTWLWLWLWSGMDSRKEYIRSTIANMAGMVGRAKDLLPDIANAVATDPCVNTFLDSPRYVQQHAAAWFAHLQFVVMPLRSRGFARPSVTVLQAVLAGLTTSPSVRLSTTVAPSPPGDDSREIFFVKLQPVAIDDSNYMTVRPRARVVPLARGRGALCAHMLLRMAALLLCVRVGVGGNAAVGCGWCE